MSTALEFHIYRFCHPYFSTFFNVFNRRDIGRVRRSAGVCLQRPGPDHPGGEGLRLRLQPRLGRQGAVSVGYPGSYCGIIRENTQVKLSESTNQNLMMVYKITPYGDKY